MGSSNEILVKADTLVSRVCEFLLLPSHALRMARIRMAARLTEYEITQSLEQELAAMREAVEMAGAMEEELRRTNSKRGSVRATAIQFFQAGVARLPARVAAVFREDALRTIARTQQMEGDHKVASSGEKAVASIVGAALVALVLGIALAIVGALALLRLWARTESWKLRVAFLIPPALLALALVTRSLSIAVVAIVAALAVVLAARINSARLLGRVELPLFELPNFGDFRW